MFYYGYHIWGMHIIWWFIWMIVIIWVFAVPYDIPGQRNKKNKPLDILSRRYARGELNSVEYNAMKAEIANDTIRKDKWLRPQQ